MSYVGWAALRSAPVLSPRRTPSGQPLWEVHYVDRVQDFPLPVPRDYLGAPLESWLRNLPVANRNVLSSGASVRSLLPEEAQLILELGHAGSLGSVTYEVGDAASEGLVAERSRRVIEAVTRDARFRREVMTAYDYKCAVSGLAIGSLPEGRATRLLDAAHIRPVGDRGPDSVSNGLSLTPTVHRLFDEGLISVQWSNDRLQLVRSPRLESVMVESQHGTVIRIEQGQVVSIPTDRSQWPSAEQVRYHQTTVFKGPQSLLS